MNPSVTDILIRPDAFFRDMISRKEDLKFPLLIVLAGSLVSAAYGYLVGGLTARMMASAMPGIETVILYRGTNRDLRVLDHLVRRNLSPYDGIQGNGIL